MKHYLAQVNIGRIVDTMDSEAMHGFASRLDEINALAEGAPGFVWRLKGDNGNATEILVYDDPMMIINMSVWESVDALFDFTYRTLHTELLRQRRDWFHHMKTPFMVMWWIPAGHEPTPQEAKAKLEHLEAHGATAAAFTFKQRFTVEAWLAAQAEAESA